VDKKPEKPKMIVLFTDYPGYDDAECFGAIDIKLLIIDCIQMSGKPYHFNYPFLFVYLKP